MKELQLGLTARTLSLFFYTYISFLFVSERGKTLFVFIVILICVVYTEVIQSLKNSPYTSLVCAINSVAWRQFSWSLLINCQTYAVLVFGVVSNQKSDTDLCSSCVTTNSFLCFLLCSPDCQLRVNSYISHVIQIIIKTGKAITVNSPWRPIGLWDI